MYKVQAEKLLTMKNNEQQRLEKQILELQNKENLTQKQKDQQKKLLKWRYEQSLKDQVEKRNNMKQKEI